VGRRSSKNPRFPGGFSRFRGIQHRGRAGGAIRSRAARIRARGPRPGRAGGRGLALRPMPTRRRSARGPRPGRAGAGGSTRGPRPGRAGGRGLALKPMPTRRRSARGPRSGRADRAPAQPAARASTRSSWGRGLDPRASTRSSWRPGPGIETNAQAGGDRGGDLDLVDPGAGACISSRASLGRLQYTYGLLNTA
jgi:hypothetical protein